MRSRGFRSAAFVVTFLLLSATTAAAQAIKIAWDPSPDPGVVGYMVFVGTAPDAPTSSVDVGRTESFIFAPPQKGVWFYFSVASYGADHVAGPRSAEVSAAADNGRPASLQNSRAVAAPPAVVCFDDRQCYTTGTVLKDAGSISSMVASPDGRLFFVEDSTSVRAVSPDGGEQVTLIDLATTDDRVVSVALDPSFATTGRAFTTELVPSRNGTELLIARYRTVHDEFGERAVIAAGLPATGAVAPLTVDAAGHVFLGLPAPADGAPRSPYDATLLRMNSDGTVPRDNASGSPVFAGGYAVPTSVVDDAQNGTLLFAGYNGAAPTTVRSVATGERADGPPALLALLGRNGVLLRADPQTDGSYRLSTLDLSEVGTVSAVAARGRQLFVAIQGADAHASIIRLAPQVVETR